MPILFALGLEFGWERIRRLGLGIVFIGAVEITFMMALGYVLGRLFGWNGTESVFLGAAMAISSSAIIVKLLADSGRLRTTSGKIVVGVLIVEDFAAVLLLAVLSGVASTGTASVRDIGDLIAKLALFTAAALVLGAIFTPRVMDHVARFHSKETLLVTALGLCFGLALLGEELGLSAAAGAFLIGSVLGDTKHARQISETMSPIRDMFAAIFFVSIGMLVNLGQLGSFIGPALVVSAVVILGKIAADTVGPYIAGHDGRTSLETGMSMPQTGEFSLAIVKVGADHGAVGAALYPVITVTTAITTVVYPFVFRSVDRVASLLDRRSPTWAKEFVAGIGAATETLRSRVTQAPVAKREDVRRAFRSILINLGVMALIIAVGTFVLRSASDLAGPLPFGARAVGLIIAAGVIVLCVPPAVALWRALRALMNEVYVLLGAEPVGEEGGRERLLAAFRDGALIMLLLILGLWSLPLFSELFALGGLAVTIPIVAVAVGVALTTRTAFLVHDLLESTFGRTFLGEETSGSTEDPQDEQPTQRAA